MLSESATLRPDHPYSTLLSSPRSWALVVLETVMPVHRLGRVSTWGYRSRLPEGRSVLLTLLTTRYDPGICHPAARATFVPSSSENIVFRVVALRAVPLGLFCALPVLYLLAHRIFLVAHSTCLLMSVHVCPVSVPSRDRRCHLVPSNRIIMPSFVHFVLYSPRRSLLAYVPIILFTHLTYSRTRIITRGGGEGLGLSLSLLCCHDHFCWACCLCVGFRFGTAQIRIVCFR